MSLLLGCIADDFTGATDLANTLDQVGFQFVDIKCAQKDWRGAATDVRMLKELGRLRRAPPDLRKRLLGLLARAERRGG